MVDSVPVSRDGMVLKAGAEVAVNENATLSLSYGGLLSQHHRDNSVNAGFTALLSNIDSILVGEPSAGGSFSHPANENPAHPGRR